MAAQIIDGKAVSAKIRGELTEEVAKLKEQGVTPGLAVVIVGEDAASQVYVKGKEKACDEIGVYSVKHALPADTSEDDIVALVGELNSDPSINGILVQLPLPDHIGEDRVIAAIAQEKDVDGFSPESVGKLMIGQDTFVSCTPQGIMVLLEEYGVDLTGKEAVVVGRSNIVGKPVAVLLLQKHATVTWCHTRTKDLNFHTGRADVLVVAAGRPEVITGDMIKEGAIVIDVGVNRLPEGKLVGDVEFESASSRASMITPVPGGVGPMTITMLMKNTVKAAKKKAGVL